MTPIDARFVANTRNSRQICIKHLQKIKRKRKAIDPYNGSASANSSHERGGLRPAPIFRNPIHIRHAQRPEKDDLDPDQTDEEQRLLRDEIVAVEIRVPSLEIKERRREEVGGEARLRVEQRRGDGDHEGEEKDDGV